MKNSSLCLIYYDKLNNYVDSVNLSNRVPHSEAYERRQDPNGMYMKHLLKHVMNDVKVEDVLHQVAAGESLLKYNDYGTSVLSWGRGRGRGRGWGSEIFARLSFCWSGVGRVRFREVSCTNKPFILLVQINWMFWGYEK